MQARIVHHGPDPDPLLRPPSRSSSPNSHAAGKGTKGKPWKPPQPSQGDFVLIDSLAGGQRPDLAAIAGEDPLAVDAPQESDLSPTNEETNEEQPGLDTIQIAQKASDMVDVADRPYEAVKTTIKTNSQGRPRPTIQTSIPSLSERNTAQNGAGSDRATDDPSDTVLAIPRTRTDMPPPERNESLNAGRRTSQTYMDKSPQRSQTARLPELSQFTIPASEGSPNETLPAMQNSAANNVKSLQNQHNLPGILEQLGPLADSPLSPDSSNRSASSIRQARNPFHTPAGTGLPTPLDGTFPRSNGYSVVRATQYSQGLGGHPSPASTTMSESSPRDYHVRGDVVSPSSRYAQSHGSMPTPQSGDLPTPHSVDSYSTFSSQTSPNGDQTSPEESHGLYSNGMSIGAIYKCEIPGCTALPFQTQYLLK